VHNVIQSDIATDRQIKVLHLISPRGVGGAERVVLTLCKGADRESVESVLGIFRDNRTDRDDFITDVEKMGLAFEEICYKNPYDISQFFDLYRIVRRLCPQVIHAHGYKTNILGFFVAKLLGIPIVTTVHGLYRIGRGSNRMVRLGVFVLRYFDRVLPVSEQIREELLRMKIPASRMVTVRNVPPLATVKSRVQTQSFREEVGISPKRKIIGFIGRLEHVKGCDQFIEAMANIMRKALDFCAVIVGDGPEREALEILVKRRGLGERVNFFGFRNDPERVLQSLDVLVLSSRNEGIPLTLLEAMAQGVPVVATQVGGVPEVIRDGVNGLLVAPGEPAKLAEAIIESLSNPEAARERTLAAKKMLARDYDVRTWAGKVRDVYKGILR